MNEQAGMVGHRLRNWRAQNRHTIRSLAKEVQCDPKAIFRAEKGKGMLSANVLTGLALVGCDVTTLLIGMSAEELRKRVQVFLQPIESDRSDA